MTRKLSISALALTVALAGGYAVPAQSSWVNAGAVTVAWQAQQVSRWQADRFGPIVSSDTMWTIASYYGRQRGVTVYDMMDAIVAANPRVFIDNRPDRMMDGYYLVIPAVGNSAPVAEQVVEQPQQPLVVGSDERDDTVQFKAEELRDLRDRLAGSIGMIEQLQTENATLQARLNDVTAELEALKAQLAEDRVIDQEIDALAGELVNQVPGVEGSQERVIETAETAETVEPELSSTEQVEQPQLDSNVVEVEQPKPELTEQRQPPVATTKPPANKAGTPDFLAWLLEPPQLYVVIAVPLLLLIIFLYMAYVRRIRREFEQQSEPNSAVSAEHDAATAATAVTDEQDAEVPSQPDQPVPQRDAMDATAVVTGLAAVTGAAVVVDHQTAETDLSSDYSDDELAAVFDQLESDTETLEAAPKADSDATDEAFDLTQFEVAEDDPLLSSGEAEDYLTDADSKPSAAPQEFSIDGLDDDDDFAKLLASLEAPSTEPSSIDQERQPPVAKREPKLHDDSLSGLSLADQDSSDDGDYVSIDALLNDAEAAEEESLMNVEFDPPSLDESKTPAAMLDLAQAYIDMGELDDARNLLKKIVGCDDADADREAALLLQQLDSQSGR